MPTKKTLVDVILPLPLKDLFTYHIPDEWVSEVQEGKRVVIPFGKKKIYTGVIVAIHHNAKNHNIRSIISIVDEKPIVFPQQLAFWNFLSEYYMAYLGEVMQAALPSALKLSGETKLMLHPDFNKDYATLNEKEFLVVEALEIQNVLSLKEVSLITEQKKTVSLVNNLIEKNIVFLHDDVKEAYKPKIEKFVLLDSLYADEEKMNALFDSLQKRAFKQLEIVMTYLKETQFFKENTEKYISQSRLLKLSEASSTQLKALEKKGVFKIIEKEVSRLQDFAATQKVSDIAFSTHQQDALQQIKSHFESQKTVLLHGVTGSGKTEIYIQLIKETIDKGKQVLYLLPEIALTSQIIERLRKYFGNLVGIYHSKYNPLERVEIWKEVLNFDKDKSSKFQIILGARSAVFLPFSQLGLVIIDEEHDSSFKQYDPAPRYNGRDAAIYLAAKHQAHCLLGTATPSLESYYNAKKGKYQLVMLTERYGNLQLPDIKLADLKIEKKTQQMHAMFSSVLYDEMSNALEAGKQIILFQNRRGFSLRIECDVCQWIPECIHCDVSMVYHKKINLLKCHYCGYVQEIPPHCPKCGSSNIFLQGFGTEKVENELQLLFPDKKIKRMDLDTTRGKGSHQRIIQEFENQKIDILVGTQMVTKGLDFDNVSLVGILNADSILTYPDFRSHEKAYQVMSQVSGRAGRKEKQGLVIIQTHQPNHQIIKHVVSQSYQQMFEEEMIHREKFHYPPFYRMIKVELKHRDMNMVSKAASELTKQLRVRFKKWVLGPDYPIVPRIRNQYIKHLFIKFLPTVNLRKEKKDCYHIIEKFKTTSTFKSVRINIDVDMM